MMLPLPLYVSLAFGLTALFTLFIFLKATNFSKNVILLLIIWLIFQSYISLNNFYIKNTFPPRFILLILPPIVSIIILFFSKKGRIFIDTLDVKLLTIIHTIRILVEIVLFWLFMYKTIPIELTFEGRNFDIISGITAPIVYYFGFIKQTLSKKLITSWNVLCVLLLLNVIFNSVLSSPVTYQNFGFNQPNIAVLHFPFVFLPSLIVPIILFSHFVVIRRLIINKRKGMEYHLETS
jgi:hypothetical protein